MSNIEYDPKFPYAVKSELTGYVSGRFPTRDAASKWAEQDDFVVVVDTSPRPKIPEDAEFIHWDNADQSFYAMRYGKTDEWWVTASGHKEDSFYYLSDLLILIGDAEITVLKRADDLP